MLRGYSPLCPRPSGSSEWPGTHRPLLEVSTGAQGQLLSAWGLESPHRDMELGPDPTQASVTRMMCFPHILAATCLKRDCACKPMPLCTDLRSDPEWRSRDEAAKSLTGTLLGEADEHATACAGHPSGMRACYRHQQGISWRPVTRGSLLSSAARRYSVVSECRNTPLMGNLGGYPQLHLL